MKISVITPTCFRPQMFKEMLESLYRTTQDINLEHITLVDVDEQTYVQAIRLSNKYTLDRINYQNYRVDFSYEKRGVSYCWNRGLEFCTGDVIFACMDDLIFHPKWLDYALETLDTKLNGYGMVGMNDLAYGENQVATQWIFTRDFCKDHMGGVIAPPVYEYLCVDLHWEGVGKMTGHYARDMRAIVEHKHSAHGKREYDKHDEDKVIITEKDMATFLEQKEKGFPVTWDSVI